VRVLLSLAVLTACFPAQALSSTELVSGGMAYSVVSVTPGKDQLRLSWQGLDGQPYGTIGALKTAVEAQGNRLLFATNSGIYAPGLKPLGLHVQRGQLLVPLNRARSGGNFALLPNGVFWVKGSRAGVSESRAYARSGLKPDYASQSGPLLVQGGKLHPDFNADSQSYKLRSGVGVCRGGPDGRMIVKFAMSEGAVNFYTFARFFRDTLGCPDALYLDGSISSIYTPDRGDRQLASYAGIWNVVGK
jgi:uncharacterized protein YigE (DUF2233 family)